MDRRALNTQRYARASSMRRYSNYRKKSYRRPVRTAFRGRRRVAAPVRKYARRIPVRRPRQAPAQLLSPCAMDYLKVQYDPWNLDVSPCVPDTITIPSYKFSTRIRGTVVTSTDAGAIAQIYMNPYLPTNSAMTAGVTNLDYLAPVWVTNGTAGVQNTAINVWRQVRPATATDIYMSPAYWNSSLTGDYIHKYFTDSVGNRAHWRPVGGGIKVQYQGPISSRSGSYHLWEDPLNSNWLGVATAGVTLPQLLANAECRTTVVTEDAVCVTFHPRHSSDLDYSDEWYTNTSSFNPADLAQYPTLAIFISGHSGAYSTYNYDCIMHWEMTGTDFPSRTVSHSDPIGTALVESVKDTAPSVETAEKQLREKARQLFGTEIARQRANSGYSTVGYIYSP